MTERTLERLWNIAADLNGSWNSSLRPWWLFPRVLCCSNPTVWRPEIVFFTHDYPKYDELILWFDHVSLQYQIRWLRWGKTDNPTSTPVSAERMLRTRFAKTLFDLDDKHDLALSSSESGPDFRKSLSIWHGPGTDPVYPLKDTQ